MSDEMIQQVPQQSGSHALSGLVGGAAIGGLTGAGAAKYLNFGITSKPKLEEVFAQDPDTFTRQIEKGGENKGAWETAQEWAKKVRDAGENYDKEVAEIKEKYTVAVDKNVDKDLQAAQKKYNEALDAEKKNIAKANAKGEFKFPSAEEVSKLEGVKLEDANEYKKLLDKYNKAFKKNVDASKAKDLSNTIEIRLANIDKISKSKGSLLKSKSKDIAKEVAELENSVKGLVPEITTPTRSSEAITKAIEKLDPASATYDADKKALEREWRTARRVESALAKAEKDFKPGTKNYNNFVKGLNNDIKEKQQSILKDILGEKTEITVDGKKVSTYENVVKYMEMHDKYNNRIANINSRKEVKDIGGTKKLKSAAQYGDELATAHKAGNKAEVARLEKLKKAAEDVKRANETLTSRRAAFTSEIPVVQRLTKSAENKARNTKEVGEALSELQAFSKKNEAIKNAAFNAADGKALTADEIAAKAVENLKEKDVAKNLETLKTKAQEKGTELSEEGKKLLDKLGTREARINSVKEEATKAIGDNLSKLKIANVGKTAAAAAAILGVAGLLFGAASKKEA